MKNKGDVSMLLDATVEKLRENGIEVQNYDDTETMILFFENGTSTYSRKDNTFEINDFMFWEDNTFEDLKRIAQRIKNSLSEEKQAILVEICSVAEDKIDYEFINVANEKAEELRSKINYLSSLYEIVGSKLERSKDAVDTEPWFSTENSILSNYFILRFIPEEQELCIKMLSEDNEKEIIVSKLIKDKGIFEDMFQKVKTQIENELRKDGLFNKFEISLLPYGFRINLEEEKKIFDFEIRTKQNEKILLVINELIWGEYTFHSTETDFFESWSENIFLSFKDNEVTFEDNGFFNTLRRRQLTSFFSY